MRKRLLSLLLAVLLAAAALSSCGKSEETPTPGNVPGNHGQAETEQPAETEPTDAVEPLPDRN
ncbi:MAG: hypothetical protein II836_00780, partial [Clostridia bacterium]|nr:hypothetical protein [Clostridia bacterium]